MAKFSMEAQCACCNLKVNIFRFLSEDELAEINKTRHEVHFFKGETIFKQGGPLTHIACLTSGLAKVYLEGRNSKNLILKILKSAEMTGGPGFPVDYRHHFSVSALTEARACFIDINVFEDMVRRNPQFSIEFIKYLNTTTIRFFEKIQTLTQKHMHGRIADSLLYLSNGIYNATEFVTELNRQEIAEMSAMTKESAIRILKEFKDDGIIDYHGNSFKILKKEQLETISVTG